MKQTPPFIAVYLLLLIILSSLTNCSYTPEDYLLNFNKRLFDLVKEADDLELLRNRLQEFWNREKEGVEVAIATLHAKIEAMPWQEAEEHIKKLENYRQHSYKMNRALSIALNQCAKDPICNETLSDIWLTLTGFYK